MKPTREMFDPYDEAAVPDIMPFPALSHILATRGAEIAVPKLNQHQRSYLFDVALRDVDLVGLTVGKEATKVYEAIKSDALRAKPFQHKEQDADRAEEEAGLREQIKAWKFEKAASLKTAKKGKSKGGGKLKANAGDDSGKPDANGDDEVDSGKPQGTDGNASDAEEDQGARKALLRGYSRAAWRKESKFIDLFVEPSV